MTAPRGFTYNGVEAALRRAQECNLLGRGMTPNTVQVWFETLRRQLPGGDDQTLLTVIIEIAGSNLNGFLKPAQVVEAYKNHIAKNQRIPTGATCEPRYPPGNWPPDVFLEYVREYHRQRGSGLSDTEAYNAADQKFRINRNEDKPATEKEIDEIMRGVRGMLKPRSVGQPNSTP